MKIKISFILFLFLSALCFSQVIKGIVVTTTEQPLSNVKIYIDGSQVSSITDAKGIFDISIPNIQEHHFIYP